MLALPRLGCINLHASLLPPLPWRRADSVGVANGAVFTRHTTHMLLEEASTPAQSCCNGTFGIAPELTAVECSMSWLGAARR